MIDTTHLAVFLAASLVLALTPGPAVLFIVARGIQSGRTAGMVSAAGIAIGSLLQVILSSLGLSALLYASAAAYHVVRWLGAAYLLYLGVRTLADRRANEPAPQSAPTGKLWPLFRAGLLVNLLNPKTALFFLSFLPQFVVTSRGPAWAQTMVFGVIFIGIAACTDSLYALLSGGLRSLLSGRAAVKILGRWVSGGIYLALGIAAAVSGARTGK